MKFSHDSNYDGREEEEVSWKRTDPMYELSSEETLRLGYEWILNSDESGDFEYKRPQPRDRHPIRGYSIAENIGQVDQGYSSDSPMQSHADFLWRPHNAESEMPRAQPMRAFDFSKSLRDVGDVHLLLGGQTPHWIGTPHFSLNQVPLTGPLASTSSSLQSLQSADEERKLEVGLRAVLDNRPPSPDSFIQLPTDDHQVTSGSTTKISEFNPWGLVGDDYQEDGRNDEEDEYASSDLITEQHHRQAAYQPTPLTTSPSKDGGQQGYGGGPYGSPESDQRRQYNQPYSTTRGDDGQQGYGGGPYGSPESDQRRHYHQPYSTTRGITGLADPYVSDPRDVYSRSREQQSTEQGRDQAQQPYGGQKGYGGGPYGSPESDQRRQYHQPYSTSRGVTGLADPYVSDPRDVYIRSREQQPTEQGRDQAQQSFGGGRRDGRFVEEAISGVERELDKAYRQLEESELEKRRLIQQLSYLRLMELELGELEAINRIIAAPVPAEEDIQILDNIIYRIRGPRYLY